VVLPDPMGYLETGERELKNSLPASQIDAVSHTDWKATWSVADLVAKSQKRVAASAIFPKIAARTTLLKARREDTRQPLEKAAWLARREAQKKELDAVSVDLEKAPRSIDVAEVVYDGHAPVAARPGGKTDDRGEKWREQIARDPWIGEALAVLKDSSAAGGASTAAVGK
jgi:hypothetical protein